MKRSVNEVMISEIIRKKFKQKRFLRFYVLYKNVCNYLPIFLNWKLQLKQSLLKKNRSKLFKYDVDLRETRFWCSCDIVNFFLFSRNFEIKAFCWDYQNFQSWIENVTNFWNGYGFGRFTELTNHNL